MSENKIIDYNGILNTVKQGYSFETDKEYWNKAQNLLPELNLPSYEDIFENASNEYPSNPKDAITDSTLINSSLGIINDTFFNQDIDILLNFVEGNNDYPLSVKNKVKNIIKARNNNNYLPGAFGYGPYANNPFNSSMYEQDAEYAAMHDLFLTNPLKWEANAKSGMYDRFGNMNPAMIVDEEWIKTKEKERVDWHNQVNLINEVKQNKEIKEVLDNKEQFLEGLSPEERFTFDNTFGDWKDEGRYISMFGGKLPLPKYKKGNDGLWTQNEYNEGKGGLFNLFGDEWLSNNSKTPEFLKTHIKHGLNNSVPAINYATETGEELYTDIPEYEPVTKAGTIQRGVETIGGGLISFIASMSDPISIGSMIIPYAAGGRFAQAATRKGIQYFSNSFQKYAPSKLQTWFNNSNGRVILNNMPNFMQGTQGYKIKETIKKGITSDTFGKLVYDVGGFSTVGAYHAMLHSRKNQRLNYGKYENNNGTINYWDTINDTWKGWRNGASMALLLNGTHQLIGRSNLLQNSYFKQKVGQKTGYGTTWTPSTGFQTFTKKAAEFGIGGTILTTVPIALDKEVRQQYYDENGYFDLSKFTADTMINTGILTLFWGIRNVDYKSFKMKEKGLVYKPEYNYRFKPYPGGKFSGNSKRDIKNIVVNKTDNNAITVPDSRSFPKFLKEVKVGLTIDSEYENNKLTNKNHYSNDGKNTLENSLANVQKDLGPESGFEFFDEISKIDAGKIETTRGLKSIKDIVDETIKILEKGAIKDRKGNIIGIDGANITGNDQNFLLYVTPTAVKAYQGYLMQYNATDDGKAEYIKRFEVERNNGKKISPAMEKTVLRALEMRLNRFDVITRDFNSMLKYGDTKAEQLVINPENKAPLAPEYMEVVLVENGKPVTGDILSIEKDTALAGIEQGKFIKKSDAEGQALAIGEVESPNQGMVTTADQEEMFARILNKALDLQKPYSSQIKTTKGEYPKFIEPYREGELGHKSLERKVDSKITTSHIKDPWDIAVLGGKESPIGAKELKKRIPALNNLMKSSGKKSLSEITTDDIRKWGNDRIAEIKKENVGKHINEQKPAVMQNNPISNVKKIFTTLKEKELIKLNPVTTEVQKYFSSHSTKTKQTLKAKQIGLPQLKVWYKKLPKVYEAMVKKNKDYQIALALGDHLSVRTMEIQALKGQHIVREQQTDIPYLDLLTPISDGGAGKEQGILRPVAISEGLYKELIKIADKKQPGSKLFPGYQQLLTKELQKTFPVGPDNIKLTAKDFKHQQISLAMRHANLSPEEARIFNTISGHAGDAAKIVEEYLASANMGDLLKLQVQVMKKVNAARIELENTMKSMPLEKAIGKVMKFVKEDLSIGLSIKDVSGKKPNEIVKTVNKEVKQGEILTSNVKKKFVASVEKVFNDLVPKNLDVAERNAMRAFYAKNAGIEDYNNFNLKSATTEELVLFSERLIREPKMFPTKTRHLVARMENIGLARRIFEANNYDNERQRKFIHLAFFPEKELSEVSYLQLDYKQSVELVNLIKGEETLNTVYDAENNIIKDKFDYVHLALNTDNIITLSQKYNKDKKFITALSLGLYGRTPDVFSFFAKILNAPELVKLGEDLNNRRLAETNIGAYIQEFEVDTYKMIFNYANEKGDFVRLRLLMPGWIKGGTLKVPFTKLKTNIPLMSLPDIQSVSRSLLGSERYKYQYGKKIFDTYVKDNLTNGAIEPKRMEWLREHVLKHPEDKEAVKRFKSSEPFYDGVYVTKNNYKELGLTEKAIGSLRTDTLESYMVRQWHKYTQKMWNTTKHVLKKSMTEASWETFIKKYPLVEVSKHFYVPRIHTEEFAQHYGFGDINIEKRVMKYSVSEAKKLAKGKYGKHPTESQIKEFMDEGGLQAWANVAVTLSDYQGNKMNPKHILRRKIYMGERSFIESENKWIWNYESAYDGVARPHSATMAKVNANIEYLPYLVGIPGLKFNHNYPKVLAKLKSDKGVISSYIHDKISAETGLVTPGNYFIDSGDKLIGSMNKYAARLFLSGTRPPLKNFGIGINNNLFRWDLPVVMKRIATSLSYRNRIEARKTGYMALSYSKLTESNENFFSVILDKFWHSFKFGSTEEHARLTAMMAATDEVPLLAEALNSSNPKTVERALYRAKVFYELTETPIIISKDIVIKGGELAILKEIGTNIEFKGNITKKDFGVSLIRTKRKLTGFEATELVKQIEKVHFKIITRAHEKAQGATSSLDQLWLYDAPLAGGGALFAKLATRGTANSIESVQEARKTGTWHRPLQSLLSHLAWGSILYYAVDEYLFGKPDPHELDRKHWKKIFTILHKAEFGGILAPVLGVSIGQSPLSNPVLPFAQINLIREFLMYITEVGAQIAEKAGFKPEKKGDFAEYFVAKKDGFGSASRDFAKTIVAAFREWNNLQERRVEYKRNQKQFDEYEKHFYNNVMPHSSRPNIIKGHINSGEYQAIQRAFELGNFEQKDGDFSKINETIFNTFIQIYDQKIAANVPPGKALTLTIQSIDSKLLSLHPIINGLGQSGEHETWFSVRTSYLSYLRQTAIAQTEKGILKKIKITKDNYRLTGNKKEDIGTMGVDKNYYWRPLMEQEKIYYKKLYSWLKQFPGWIRKNKSKQVEAFKINAMTKIHPKSWDLLGLPNINKELIEKYSKDLNK